MKATIEITFDNGTTQSFTEGDFWEHQFKCDLEDKNTAFLRIGGDYINKNKIVNIKPNIEKGDNK